MTISRIEQLIEDIYEFVESCRMQPFSTTKVIMPKDELYDLLDELRLRTPDEIKRYQKIIANRDAILADAEEKAKAIVDNADNRALSMINEHEIMQKAYDQANEMVSTANKEAEKILMQANYEANQIRTNSLAYTEELLNSVEDLVSTTYNKANSDYQVLIKNLKNTLDTINSNKEELAISTGNEAKDNDLDLQDESSSEESHSDDDLEYAFDEDTFLKDID